MSDTQDLAVENPVEETEDKKPIPQPLSRSEFDFQMSKTKLITPGVMLSGTAVIAVYTYFQRYRIDRWLVLVLAAAVVFMILGAILEGMIGSFQKKNHEKALALAEEARLAEEAAQAEAEAEAAEAQGVDETGET